MLAASLTGLASLAGLRAGFVAAIVRGVCIHHRYHCGVFHRAGHQRLGEMRVALQRNRNGKQQEEEYPKSTHGLTLACAAQPGKAAYEVVNRRHGHYPDKAGKVSWNCVV